MSTAQRDLAAQFSKPSHKRPAPRWRVLAEGLDPEALNQAVRIYHSQTENMVLALDDANRTRAANLFVFPTRESTPADQIDAYLGLSAVAAASIAVKARQWAYLWCVSPASVVGCEPDSDDEWAAHCRTQSLRASEQMEIALEAHG